MLFPKFGHDHTLGLRSFVVAVVILDIARMARIELGLGQVFGQLLQLIARVKDLLTLRIPDGKRTRSKGIQFFVDPIHGPL